MSNFPTSLDDDTTLPVVNDNITEIGGQAINALRDAVFALEQNVGIGAAGSTGSIAARLGISINPDGTIKASALTALGLVTLPITQNQIADNAQIPESKLKLDFRTQDLFNYIRDLSKDVNSAQGWIATSGVKLEAHLIGAIYRHNMDQIDVSNDLVNEPFLNNKFRVPRDNTSAYSVVNDMNSEFLAHQWADGSPFGIIKDVTTNNGSVYPSNYGHTASGIFLNTTRFSTIPQSAVDLQLFAEFIDSASIFLYGTRIQNLYTGGISRSSRSSWLALDGYGTPLIPPTPAITYFLNTGTNSKPFDDINFGDDIIEFKPAAGDISSNLFDERFALVKIGDIARVNYGTIEVQFVIKEKKYIQSGGNKKYIIRIAGKNLLYTTNASVRIDKPLFNNNKQGVLAIAPANNKFSAIPSLIVGSPRGAMTLGVGFNADQLDESHYLLYLALYPDGNPMDGYTILPPIDVTGNKGVTPGEYTLDSVVEATNTAFRNNGYNYRFIAYSYQGEFGIMLADSYGDAGFSIMNAVISPSGFIDQAATNINFPNNVVGMFSTTISLPSDPLGFGPNGANVASPPFMKTYGSPEAAIIPTKVFLPLKRNNYYVNGIERDKLNLEVGQALDGYGDGYWIATISDQHIFPGPGGRVQTTYHIPLDLSTSHLQIGKTLVVQSQGQGGLVDFGRFIIQDLNFGCAPNIFTEITVYDAVHGQGASPVATLGLGATVAIYFNSDSVSFNKESATDFNSVTPFKRHFEVYVDQNGFTFTHERGRINVSGGTLTVNSNVSLFTYSELAKLNILKISPKLRGYQFSSVNKITLNMLDYNSTTGNYSGYLAFYDGYTFTHKGPLTVGKKGQITRFYDETNVDYIDILFDVNDSVASFTNKQLDFQLFPTLSLDEEINLIGTCQLNDVTNFVNYLRDERQFGNTSEKDLSTSALNFISLPERLLHSNGVIRGFDLEDLGIPNPDGYGRIYLTGGLVVVNGKIISLNNETIVIPLIKETGSLHNVNWMLCVNDKGEYQPIPLLDFDPTLNTPNNPTRVFTAFNLVSGTTYSIDASTFSDLINNRKDLTLLYIVASTTTTANGSTPPTISLDITDARKYVNDADSNLPLKLTSAHAQGNFKSPIAIFNWVKYNNLFNGNAIVKGADSTTGQINTALNLDFANTVTIDGENDALLTMNKAVVLGSNLTLKNLSINFYGGVSLAANATNLTLDNCTINIVNPIAAAPTNNIIFDAINGKNITIKDCNITVQYTNLVSSGAVFRLTNTTGFTFDGGSVAVTFDISPGAIMPGDVFIIKDSPGVKIIDAQFSGNFNQVIRNTRSNKLRVKNCSITSTYNPNLGVSPDFYDGTTDPIGIADGLPVVTYTTALGSAGDFVNTGRGYIYSNVEGTLDDIEIDACVFNYSPAVSSGERFSFINFELTNVSSILSNLRITNCRFNNTNTSSLIEDLRSAIAIINRARGAASNIQQPSVVNANISHNYCNRDQSIILTSKTVSGTLMRAPALATQNVTISNNACGTIGYWVSAGSKIINVSPAISPFSDKNYGLSIIDNTCHLITNVDHTGHYWLVSKLVGGSGSVNQCSYPSGYVEIRDNSCNWIHVGIAYEESSALHIMDNSLNAYDMIYLSVHNDIYPNDIYANSAPGFGISSGFAIFVGSNKHTSTNILAPGEGQDSPVIISGNVTGAGYWLLQTNTAVTYNYQLGYIMTQSSSTITNNNLRGVGETAGLGALISLGGLNNIVTNNFIYRQGKSVFAYIAFVSYDVPVWDGTGSTGIVTNNFLDSPVINDATGNEAVIDINILMPKATRWIVTQNKNQTGYITVPITNTQLILHGGFGYADFDNETLYITQAPTLANGYKSLVLRVHDEDTVLPEPSPTGRRFFGWQENLDKYLPVGVRILNLQMGMKPFGSIVQTPVNPAGGFDSNFYLFLNRYIAAPFYVNLDYMPVPGVSPDTAVLNDATPSSSIITGGMINSTSATIFFNIDTTTPSDISDNFIAGVGIALSASLDIRFKRQNICDFYFSPLKVKYRW